MLDADGSKEDQTFTIRKDPALKFGGWVNDNSWRVDNQFGWQLKVVDAEARASLFGLSRVKDVEGLLDAHIVDEEGRVVTVNNTRETAARICNWFWFGEKVERPFRLVRHDVDLARHVLEVGSVRRWR